eukprot:1652103-Rhodomonas_salina.1
MVQHCAVRTWDVIAWVTTVGLRVVRVPAPGKRCTEKSRGSGLRSFPSIRQLQRPLHSLLRIFTASPAERARPSLPPFRCWVRVPAQAASARLPPRARGAAQ